MQVGVVVFSLFQLFVRNFPYDLSVGGVLDGQKGSVVRKGQGDESFCFGNRYGDLSDKKLKSLFVGIEVEQGTLFIGRKGSFPQKRFFVAGKILDAHPLCVQGKENHA